MLAMKELSVIVPCYNEENTLLDCLKRVRAVSDELELIVVDDASSDKSWELLTAHQDTLSLTLCQHQKNSGKGAALNTGFKQATRPFIIIQDADTEYNPEEYPALLQPLLNDEADVVYGSRFINKRNHFIKRSYIANKLLTALSNLCSGLKLSDMETCYKVFKRSDIKSMRLEEKRFGIEPELTAKFAKRQLRIKELPISYQARHYDAGKKIGVLDGISAIFCILKYNCLKEKRKPI